MDWDRLLLQSENLTRQVGFDLFAVDAPLAAPEKQAPPLRHALITRTPLPVAQDHALPRVERDILQVEQFSQKLRARAAAADASAEALDASRLLAGEGFNNRK